MPELPEVETIRRDLKKEILGKKIADIQVNLPRLIKSPTDMVQFVTGLKGKFIKEVSRRGKYIICLLDSGDRLIFHLGMSGFLLYHKRDEVITTRIRPKHNHLCIFFEDGSEIIYNDVRQFGKIWLIKGHEKISRIENLGWEPLEESFSLQTLVDSIQNKKTNIKSLLMNQRIIAGIGNIYANEILFMAGIHPLRKGCSLSTIEIERLYHSIRSTLKKAVIARGMTMEDESYRDLLGQPGNYRQEVMVYGKKNDKCPTCGNPLSLIRIENRSTFFCSNCQK